MSKFLAKLYLLIFALVLLPIPTKTYADVDCSKIQNFFRSECLNFQTWNSSTNLQTQNLNWTNRQNNLNILQDNNVFFWVSKTWEAWIRWLLLNIARDVRLVVYPIILIVWMIMVFRLLFASNTEEDAWKLKKWILWASIWIIVMQTSFSMYEVMFDQSVNASLAKNVENKLIAPFLDLLMLLVSFLFIFVAIFSFYRIITAWWDEEKIKKWKTSIFQAMMWFLVIKIADTLVTNTLKVWCVNWFGLTSICNQNITENALIITTFINWMNAFIALIMVLLVIYAWFLVMTSGWDDEKMKKAKNIMIYIWIWLFILFASYLILSFFIFPEKKI